MTGRVLNPDGTPAKDANVFLSVIWPFTGGGNMQRIDYPDVKTDDEGRFRGYMRRFGRGGPAQVSDQTAVSIEAYAWLPDLSLGGVGRVEARWGEPLARPLEVKLEKTGTVVLRVVSEDGMPVANAYIAVDAAGSHTGSVAFRPAGAQRRGPSVVYTGDGRYRIAGLIPGLVLRFARPRWDRGERLEIRDIEVKPGQTIDAGELRLELKEGTDHPAGTRKPGDEGIPAKPATRWAATIMRESGSQATFCRARRRRILTRKRWRCRLRLMLQGPRG